MFVFHWTAEFVLKFVPVMAKVNVPTPTVADVGATVEIVGMIDGCPMVKITAFDGPPVGF